MDLLLDLLTGLGVAAAVGIRPFLPALAVGLLAAADVGVDFDGTALAFLENPVFLAVLALLVVAAVAARGRLDEGPAARALPAAGVVLGALLFGATLDDGQDTWWYGLLLGAAVAYGASVVTGTLLGRVRERFARAKETEAAAFLPFYAVGAALVAAVLSVLLPPAGLLVAGFLAYLGLQQRRRSGEKYAGLRVLR